MRSSCCPLSFSISFPVLSLLTNFKCSGFSAFEGGRWRKRPKKQFKSRLLIFQGWVQLNGGVKQCIFQEGFPVNVYTHMSQICTNRCPSSCMYDSMHFLCSSADGCISQICDSINRSCRCAERDCNHWHCALLILYS